MSVRRVILVALFLRCGVESKVSEILLPLEEPLLSSPISQAVTRLLLHFFVGSTTTVSIATAASYGSSSKTGKSMQILTEVMHSLNCNISYRYLDLQRERKLKAHQLYHLVFAEDFVDLGYVNYLIQSWC